jgi:hypothetical protein
MDSLMERTYPRAFTSLLGDGDLWKHANYTAEARWTGHDSRTLGYEFNKKTRLDVFNFVLANFRSNQFTTLMGGV